MLLANLDTTAVQAMAEILIVAQEIISMALVQISRYHNVMFVVQSLRKLAIEVYCYPK
jgi:hypothetical protein